MNSTIRIRCSSLPHLSFCSAPLEPVEGAIRIDPVNSAATLGTVVHSVVRKQIEFGQPGDVASEARNANLPEDMFEEVGPLAGAALAAWKQMAPEFPDPVCEFEMRHEFKVGKQTYELTGMADVVAKVTPELARGGDWKSGWNVEKDHYHQMAGYAFLMMMRFEVETVEMNVVNLRNRMIQRFAFTRAELLEWFEEVVKKGIVQNTRVYRPGEHCEHCPINSSCPAVKEMIRGATTALTADGSPIDLTALADPAQRLVVGKQIGEIWGKLSVITSAVEKFKSAVRDAVKQHGGVNLGDGRLLSLVPSNVDSIDVVKAWPIVSEKLTEDELAPCVKITKTKLLEAVGNKAPPRMKAKWQRDLMEELDAAGAVSKGTIYKLTASKVE